LDIKEETMKDRGRTRREFLKDTTSAALAGSLYLSTPLRVFAQSEKKARVVLIRNRDVLDDLNQPREKVVQEMLDRAVTTLLDTKDPVQAWKKLLKPTDVVGIKSNQWRPINTPPELEKAIKKRIEGAGVPAKNIGIDDRGARNDPLFINSTALINVRPLRTHHWSGVGTLIKNYIIFADDPSDYHPDTCADLAAIWEFPVLKGKTRLNILVLFTPLFHGIGPHHFAPKYTWAYKGLLVGLDPVAVDATGVRILLAKRKSFFGEERPLNPPPKHVLLADTRHHLGTADPGKIELIKLGWQDDILI
jgi:hypothetical protein